ncbi:probable G-protein coupled receptor 19 [Centruroides sculpturatus]|uniref:probable G-protein coupled receptor 19 n=1 Tax=Centruroides sculpturatus TaxID=218467 RepID=UPI000C6E2776|nr:probable G-protein coupled receptor 19 [Centruroides sculpturatus]
MEIKFISERRMIVLHVIASFVVIIVFFAGIFGNLMVCVIFFRSRLFYTHKNSLHISLAVADCISCCFNSSLCLASIVIGPKSSLNSALCQTQVTIYTIVYTINLVTLATICILRTLILLYSRKRVPKKLTYTFIIISWLMGILLSILSNTLFEDDFYEMCASVDIKTGKLNFGRLIGVPIVIICFVIILSCYFIVLRKRFKENVLRIYPVLGDAIKYQITSSVKDPVVLHSNMTSIHTTLILGLILFISYLPLTLLTFIPPERMEDRHSWFLFAFSISLVMSMLNPYVYSLRCAAFQKEVAKLTKFTFCCKK